MSTQERLLPNCTNKHDHQTIALRDLDYNGSKHEQPQDIQARGGRGASAALGG